MPKSLALRHARYHRHHLLRFPHLDRDVPKSVRLIYWATTARWFGWGFGELLIPIFLFSFTGTYAEAGLLASTLDIAYLLALPVAGLLADRISGANLFILGAFLYPFIGTSYFLAGVTGMAFFIVLARFTNGVSHAFDSVARETYTRHHVPKDKIAGVFGYFDMLANFWWMAAALIGLLLIRVLPIHGLLFLIVPFSLVTIFLAVHLRHGSLSRLRRGFKGFASGRAYFEMALEFGRWDWRLQLLGLTSFFLAIASSVASFFIPILAFKESGDLSRAVLIGVAFTLPTLFGLAFGRVADRYKDRAITWGLFVLAATLVIAILCTGILSQMLVGFLIGLVLEFVGLASNGLITATALPEHFGRVSGVMGLMGDIGSLAGPVFLGLIIDRAGAPAAFGAAASIAGMLGMLFIVVGKSYRILPVRR